MNTQYTPGPWHVAGTGSASSVLGKDDETIPRIWATDRAAVAQISTRKSITEKGPSAEMLSNARLIAAAPDLLAALRDLADSCTSRILDVNTPVVPMLSAVLAARAAISKATNGNGK